MYNIVVGINIIYIVPCFKVITLILFEANSVGVKQTQNWAEHAKLNQFNTTFYKTNVSTFYCNHNQNNNNKKYYTKQFNWI